jgi:crotonobetainyl-CoA:carnitine CoA-transferase CaiB-like acyl-CoA transferase
MEKNTGENKKPLDGIKVLDITRYLPGPFATQLLADFGAEVIKVEEPNGELGRFLPPFIGGLGTRFCAVNRNKKSITIDLKSQQGKEIFKKLALSADIVIEQFRPGVMDKMGLGYNALKELNEGLIYCSITGYGLSGPWVNRAGHDINYLNTSGISALTAGRDGVPVMSSVQIADVAGGSLYAVIGVLLALFHRSRSGKGQIVDISMMDGALSLLAYTVGEWCGKGSVPETGREFLTGGFAMYNTYRCGDGRYAGLGAIEGKFWSGFCTKISRENYINLQYDISKQDEIIADINNIMLERSRDEWVSFFADSDICFTPVLDLDEVSEHEQVKAREMLVKVMNFKGSGSDLFVTGNPVKLSGTPCEIITEFPETGGDAMEILIEAGYTREEVEDFINRKII